VIASVFRVDADVLRDDAAPIDLMLGERSLCVNTTAAGGNASLMSIG
jgi:delta 1-pyrroline-5-carboxylate dehydrogenase